MTTPDPTGSVTRRRLRPWSEGSAATTPGTSGARQRTSSSASAATSSFSSSSSIYPLTPRGSTVLVRYSSSPFDYTLKDKIVVICSSLFFVGGVFWVPTVYACLVQKYRRIPPEQKRRRLIYGSLLATLSCLYLKGPHRHPTFGEKYAKVYEWSLWKSWMKFFAYEIVADNYDQVQHLLGNPRETAGDSAGDFASTGTTGEDSRLRQAILGISPHGVFPFGLAFAALSDSSSKVLGKFRAVVATATYLLPWVRDVLCWVRAVDASRPSVDRALRSGHRIGLAPGGIREMLTVNQTSSSSSSSSSSTSSASDEEYAIIRKGIFRMAAKHNAPIVPIYCFGSSMLLKRLKLPVWIEKLGLLLRMSLVVMFGQYGLPIPFRQRLMYVIGNPIYPTTSAGLSGGGGVRNDSLIDDQVVDDMYRKYCNELVRIFDRHKESYAAGWESKTLTILAES